MSLNQKSARSTSWLARLMALLALLNLVLVLFNLSYIPNRIVYWEISPRFTQEYDRFRGIQPHPVTQDYLAHVDALEQLAPDDWQTPPAEELLAELRTLSRQLVLESPLAGANANSILEKIRSTMRDRLGTEPAPVAFEQFWSADYLNQSGEQELNFFDTQIRHLLETNYYRDVDRFGKYVDWFWLLDLPFIILFALDFLIRSFIISRRNPQLNWLEAMLRRWYDLFLLLPLWQWLRILPVAIRLYQTNLLNLEPIRAQINYDVAINFAEDIAKVVGVRAIDQVQKAVSSGAAADWLFHPEARRPYHTVNDIDEVKAIASRLVDVSVYDVLPQIQPDVEALLNYSLQSSFKQLPASQLQALPGVSDLSRQIAQNIAQELSHAAYSNLKTTLEDPVVAELTNRLIVHFRDVLESELQKRANLRDLENLLVDMLEEIKINYVKGIEEDGVDKLKEETDRLEQVVKPKTLLSAPE
ncbi:MAG: hypothetical protein ACFB4I_18195 [Cyanophyceae cyanobacterium]